MTACPAFLRITINNRLDLDEIFRHDLLILCPAQFNVTFRIPNWGQHPDKTFDVHFEDSRRTYDVYLTHMRFEQQHVAVTTAAARRGRLPETSGVVFAVALAVVGCFFLVCLVLYVNVQTSRSAAKKPRAPSVYSSCKQVESNGAYATSTMKRFNHRRNALIAVYVLMRLAYSIVFTFTVFFSLLTLFVWPDCTQLSAVGNFQQQLFNRSVSVAADVDRYSRTEMLAQTRLVNDMQRACGHYIDDLIQSLARQMETLLFHQRSPDAFRTQSTVSRLIQTRMTTLTEEYESEIANFTRAYKARVDDEVTPVFARYKKYLQNLLRNDWLTFPQRLFNQSATSGKRRPLHAGMAFSGNAVDFASFLEIEEVERIQVMPAQFWHRYGNMCPDIRLMMF